MSELFLTGIGLICLLFTWQVVWKRSILDATRDELFDLRDITLHDYFNEEGRTHADAMYGELRELINGHLRHTESISLIRFGLIQEALKKQAELNSFLLKESAERFSAADPRVQKIVDEIRFRSSVSVLQYMIKSSIIGVIFSTVFLIVIFFKKLPLKTVLSTGSALKIRTTMEQYAIAS